MSNEAKDVKPTEKADRGMQAIGADLQEARAELKRLHPICDQQYIRRQDAVDRYNAFKKRFESDELNTGRPFDPSAYSPPLYIPPQTTPEADQFYGLHYKVAALEVEYEAAKRKLVGR